jgi:hypothetical protein
MSAPDRFGHEWRALAGLIECRLCGAIARTPAADQACEGSAAEPGSLPAAHEPLTDPAPEA